MQSADWKAMGDEDRRQFVKDTLEDFRSTARGELLERHPEIAKAAGSPPDLMGALQIAQRKAPPRLPPLPAGFQLRR
jgi:hypothetical protein